MVVNLFETEVWGVARWFWADDITGAETDTDTAGLQGENYNGNGQLLSLI